MATTEQILNYIDAAGIAGNLPAIAQAAAQYGVSAEQLGAALNYAPADVVKYASDIGVNIPASTATKEAVVTDAFINQYGRNPTASEMASSLNYLGTGGGYTTGTQALTKTLEGYNYDVQDITAAFRQIYGRNPTQEEFVRTAANLGINNVNREALQFDNYQDALINEVFQAYKAQNPNNLEAAYRQTIATALQQGVTVDQLARSTGFTVDQVKNAAATYGINPLTTYEALRAANPFRTSASVAALESDPYGGRFATVNPYSQEGVNLSQTRAGDFIQYTTPVTGKPMTVRFENGKMLVQEGDEVRQDANAIQAIERSFGAGTLTEAERNQLREDLTGAKSMAELYDALSRPQAQVVLDPTYGFQTGQGKTLAEAQASAVPIQSLVNQTQLGVMPGVSVIQELAKAQGVDYAYTPESFGMQALPTGGFDFSAAPAFSTLYTTRDLVNPPTKPNFYPTFAEGVQAALARPRYEQTRFTGQQGIGTVVTPETYADRALLGPQAPGAPGIIGLPAPGTYPGVPAAAPQPAINVSPEGYGAQDVAQALIANAAVQANAGQGMRGGGIASLMERNYNEDEDEYEYGLGGLFKSIGKAVKKVAKPISKILPFVAPFIPGVGPVAAAAMSGVAGALGGGKGFDFKRGLMSGLQAYGLANLSQGLMQAGQTAVAGPASNIDPGLLESGMSTADVAAEVAKMPATAPAAAAPPNIVQGTLENIQAAGRGAVDALSPGITGEVARNVVGQSFGPGSAGIALTGMTGTAAIDEQARYEAEQAALAGQDAEKRRRLQETAYANMRANPYRFIAEGGYIDDNSVVDMASGGLREGSFVVPADVVSHIGNGSSEAGLKALARKYGAKPIKGAGDGMSDSIPTTIAGRERARVADGEAVIGPEVTAKVGPKKLYDMMDKVRKARTGTKKQGKQINSMQYLPA